MMNIVMMLAAADEGKSEGTLNLLLDILKLGAIGVVGLCLFWSFNLVKQANTETDVALLKEKGRNANGFRMLCFCCLGVSIAIEVAKIWLPTQMKARVSVAPLADSADYGRPAIRHKHGNIPTDIPLDSSGYQVTLQPDDIIAVNLEELMKKTDSIKTERDVLKKTYVAPPVNVDKPFDK